MLYFPIAVVSYLLLFAYILLLLYYLYHLNKHPDLPADNHNSYTPFVSIIIAGRNEEENIKNCLESIFANSYPITRYEVIYVDDHSEDRSVQILKNIKFDNFKWYALKDFLPGDKHINSYKKEALALALSKAKGDIIIQTDADVTVQSGWISSFVKRYDDNTVLITAPVLIREQDNSGLLYRFQRYDLLTTMGITAAGIYSKLHFLANGANMSYRKKVVDNQNNYKKYASGDDMFLIQTLALRNPEGIAFLKDKNAIVYTQAEKNIKSFFMQRLRWASKTTAYPDKKLKLVVILVFLVNLLFLSKVFLLPFAPLCAITFIIIKTTADVFFVISVNKHFQQKINPIYLILSLLLYPVFFVTTGTLSLLIKKYYWKGRKVR